MGFIAKFNELLIKLTSARDLSPHSWDNFKPKDCVLEQERIDNVISLLSSYYGESNHTYFLESYLDFALKIEKKINFLTNNGEQLNRELALLLSFDIARVFKNQSFDKVEKIHSIIVYHMGLPNKSNATGLMIPKGFKSELGNFYVLKLTLNLLELLHSTKDDSLMSLDISELRKTSKKGRATIHDSINDYKLEFANWEYQITSGLDSNSKSRLMSFVLSYKEFLKEHYTSEKISSINHLIDSKQNVSFTSPKQVFTKIDEILESWSDLDPAEEYSIHLSWMEHLNSMAHSNKNLFIHELSHVLDFQNLISFNFCEDENPWDLLLNQHLEDPNFFLGSYALSNSKELFATASEFFFKDPEYLKQKEPNMYELLTQVYGRASQKCDPSNSKQILNIAKQLNLTE